MEVGSGARGALASLEGCCESGGRWSPGRQGLKVNSWEELPGLGLPEHGVPFYPWPPPVPSGTCDRAREGRTTICFQLRFHIS